MYVRMYYYKTGPPALLTIKPGPLIYDDYKTGFPTSRARAEAEEEIKSKMEER